MRKIILLDTTLRDGEQSPGCTMHLSEKVEVAKKLERLGIDVIEAGFPTTSLGDLNAVKAIAADIKNCEVCALARAIKSDIDTAYNSIANAVAPRIHLFIATSPLHMQVKLKLTPQEVLERIAFTCAYAKKLLNNVQFSFEDSTRSDISFLISAVKTAIKNGATTVNFADTVGYSSPESMREMINAIKNNVDLTNIEFGVHCHNDLGMAVANTLSAIKSGVNHVEGTITGIGERSGNAALEEIIMALHTLPHEYNAKTGVDTTSIYSTSKLISNIIGMQIPQNKPIIGSNAFVHESGIHQHGLLADKATYEIISPESIGVPKQLMVLGKHSGKHAFEEYLKELNYSFEPAEVEKHFQQFKALCDKKKLVTRLDIEALIAGQVSGSVKKIYELKNFLIATKKDGAFATITLSHGNKDIAMQSEGNGAIDSCFCAVNKILSVDYKLIDFSIHAVTSGEDALGEAIVKLRNSKLTMTGRGISTDIIEAGLLAYLDAANKLLSEENAEYEKD